MKRKVLKEDVGKFGEIIAGEKGFKKTMHGRVLYVDSLAWVVFLDNDDISYRFPQNLIDSFEEQEFNDKSK